MDCIENNAFNLFQYAGTRLVHSFSSGPEVILNAGIHPQSGQVLHILNLKDEQVEIVLKGVVGDIAFFILIPDT